MRLKLLLVLLLTTGMLKAQDTIKSLLITEAFLGDARIAYFEITNMGSESVQLSQFKFAEIRPWGPLPWEHRPDRWWMLPDHILAPGECFVMAGQWEFGPRKFREGLDGYAERENKPEMVELADLVIQVREKNGDETDLVDEWGTNLWGDIYNGRSCFFLEQHFANGDSAVIDQVNGWFDGPWGLNFNDSYDIAGVSDASRTCYLIRKFSVKTGNLDFPSAAGIGEDDGEWIVVPVEGEVWRDPMWTVHNHGAYVLDENTLESDIADIDFAAKTITVPWGTRKADGVMHLMNRKPGIAWNYAYNTNHADSLTFAAKTGDVLKITVCGNTGYRADFTIIAAEPGPDAKTIVPVANESPNGLWRDAVEQGILTWPRVTQHESGMDSIWGSRGGIPFATRIDTLLERLEKPSNATWEVVWVDGVERPDLKNGDILRIKAQDGSTKDYYIAVLPIRPSHNAQLAYITWPDIPEYYKGFLGWVGDTIPNFGPTVYNYRITLPLGIESVPALVARTQDPNAKVVVNRAKNLNGSKDDRTISFTVTAEDDTTIRVYNIELEKGQNPVDVQPWHADPFLSELVFWDQWTNSFGEVYNPGNQPLDLSNYMFAMSWVYDPAAMIQARMAPEDWINRYEKYVPGYKWVNEAQWAVTPGILEQDLNVNPIVQPNDVFCFGSVATDRFTEIEWDPDYRWPVPDQLDIQFNNYSGVREYANPWNEAVDGDPIRKWNNAQWYMFKILNDSIKQGLKPANDPADFELIEVFGMGENVTWTIGGKNSVMIENYMRKPDIYKGNPTPKGSFGTTPEDTEWTWTNSAYWDNLGTGWPYNILYVGNDIGKHFMNTVTTFMSTISSVVYKVSSGYGKDGTFESVRGMTPDVTVNQFLANIIKKDENQVLKVKSTSGEIMGDELLSNNDTLWVMSADSTNVTQYILEVAEGGLSDDALLVSNRYDVTVTTSPNGSTPGAGTITGFEYGTTLKTILANVIIPMGASLDVVDGEGAYVPLTMLNFDTVYVNVAVDNNTYLDVIAENGIAQITYQLIPDVSENDAFITSNVYVVSQGEKLVNYIPRGTDVSSFLANIVPSAGATVKVLNKMGQERTLGYITDDDKVVVTSTNGEHTTVYYLDMLADQYSSQAKGLAYILSNIYQVNQIEYKINGLNGGTTVAELLSRITEAPGATAMVIDGNGNEKTTGTITGTDKVKVVSEDGKITVLYSFGRIVKADITNSGKMELYPNPTTGIVNIRGINVGSRIQVFSSTGTIVRDLNATDVIQTISLDNQPAGLYMIVVTENDQLTGRFKAVKK